MEQSYFAVIPGNVLNDASLRWSAMILYARLTAFAKRDGFCYANNETLRRAMCRVDPETGEEVPISLRTLKSLLTELKERGYISIDTGLIPSTGKYGRRIFIGSQLPSSPKKEKGCPAPKRAETCTHAETCTPKRAETCTQRGQKSAPVYNSINNINKKYNPPKSPQREEAAVLDLFECFWAAYPRKQNKPAAQKAWRKLAPNMELCRRMAEALSIQKRSRQWTKDGGRYIPLPSSWLNGKYWEDQLLPGDLPPFTSPAPYQENAPERGRYL